jgi:AraC-like DNA-binding protein
MSTQKNKQLSLGRASIPAVNQYLQLATAQQLIIEPCLNKLALTPELLADHDQSISGEKFQQLISELIILSDDELFGLHTAQYVQPGSYSILGFIVMSCKTLGEAITKIQPFEKLVGDMGSTTLTEQKKLFSIGWNCIFPNEEVRRHMVDNCLASWLVFAHYLTSKNGAPVQVRLTRSTPNLTQCAEYQKIFNCQVLFNQPVNEIVFAKAFLDLPLNKGNKQLLPTLEQHATNIIASLKDNNDIVILTEQLIFQQLKNQKINQAYIAEQLNISSKTLQRRLKAKHTHFKEIVDNVRLKQSKDLLSNTLVNIDEISQQLGFSEARSFYRWFQKKCQQTPASYRKKMNH